MGTYYLGAPRELVLALQEAVGATTFVETGTCVGNTAAWAATAFDRVLTVEMADSLYAKALELHGDNTRIEFHKGDSRRFLADVVPTLNGPALFWLDAHWSEGETYGADDPCPLLEELRILNGRSGDVIIIDDARQFLSPPPHPHDAQRWPDIISILHLLAEGRKVVVWRDCIVAVPLAVAAKLVEFCQRENTCEWEEREETLRVSGMSALAQSRYYLARGIRLFLWRLRCSLPQRSARRQGA
jgi:hypothetical protein